MPDRVYFTLLFEMSLQGAPGESPYGHLDMWSSDGWKGNLDTARSDFSSIPSDTSSPRQYVSCPLQKLSVMSQAELRTTHMPSAKHVRDESS